jgi:hypothetical protein
MIVSKASSAIGISILIDETTCSSAYSKYVLFLKSNILGCICCLWLVLKVSITGNQFAVTSMSELTKAWHQCFQCFIISLAKPKLSLFFIFLMEVVLLHKSDGFICRDIICVNSGFWENAIIEGKISNNCTPFQWDNDCYIHLYYLNIYSGVRAEIDIFIFKIHLAKVMIHSVGYH